MRRIRLDQPRLYINRELSWLAFNQRVLEEAKCETNPLLERVKFLAITASNLDEFVEIRVAGLMQRIEDGYHESGPDGMEPNELLAALSVKIHELVADQYRCWNNSLLPSLDREGIHIHSIDDLDQPGRRTLNRLYEQEIDPLLTPVTIDPAHPFPRVINKALCIAFLLKRKRRRGAPALGVVTVPRVLPRLLRLPSPEHSVNYIFLHEVVSHFAPRLYRGYEVMAAAAFRVTRNSNLYLQEEESRDLLESVRTELHNRRKGDAVRLEIEDSAPPEIIEKLRTTFELEEWQVFRTDGPVNLSRLFSLHEQTQRPDLKFTPFVPREPKPAVPELFSYLQKKELLLHHPFDSYDCVVAFLKSAAHDPSVLSIKQTLYRTSENSQIFRALIEAAQTKEVTVVVELKARFDEASNIRWARSLEDAGVQVSHGLVGLKTHCKLALLVRQEADGRKERYAHIGTGNYNPITGRLYTDLSLFTANPQITSAVHGVFNFLTAYAETPHYDPLFVAPRDLAERCLWLIEREAEHARQKRPARIIAKMNALLDQTVIQALYAASQAGVEIDLIVRAGCALRPGIAGVSDRIRVISVVGRFLEHSRIFYFANGGAEEIYIGSADWMPRNLYERVEVLCPILDQDCRQRLRDEILLTYWRDNVKARELHANGNYSLRDAGAGVRVNAQQFFLELAEGNQTLPKSLPPDAKAMRAAKRVSRKKAT